MVNTISFQSFWNLYALKRNRIAAERVWKKLSTKDRKAAIDGIKRYTSYCAKRGISRMYAQGYLNYRRWEDEEEQEETPVEAVAPEPSQPTRDVWDNRIGCGITDEEHKAFDLLKKDLRMSWCRHRDDINQTALQNLLNGLELYGINDNMRVIYIHAKHITFNRQHTVPWFWMPEMFDILVASRFNGYNWQSC